VRIWNFTFAVSIPGSKTQKQYVCLWRQLERILHAPLVVSFVDTVGTVRQQSPVLTSAGTDKRYWLLMLSGEMWVASFRTHPSTNTKPLACFLLIDQIYCRATDAFGFEIPSYLQRNGNSESGELEHLRAVQFDLSVRVSSRRLNSVH
jgi:hypothetical protein